MVRNIFTVFLFVCSFLGAQVRHGVVLDMETGAPLSGVKVSFEDSDLWTLTDSHGVFEIDYTAGETLIFSRANYIELLQSFPKISAQNITVKMQRASVRIDEITLTEKKKDFSSIEIKEEALQKTQAFSLCDVLQQLPGQYISPLQNTQMKNIVLRSANVNSIMSSSDTGTDFGNKAFGTQLMVNEIPVSNNENMQLYNSPYSDPFGQSSYGFNVARGNSTLISPKANFGADLRQIPTEDIEKIEVIAGIPDAKYGDLTSGLIKVETKAGKRPLQLLTSIADGTYQFGASKGFGFRHGGSVNVSLNYMNTEADPRLSDIIYRRYNGNILWASGNKKQTLRNRLTLNVSASTNQGQGGEDEYHGVFIKATSSNFSVSNSTSLRFGEKSFVKNINANVGLDYGKQNSMRRNFINSQGVPYGTALGNSVYTAEYTLPQYFNYNYVDGKPINFFADADASSRFKTDAGWIHNIVYGLSYRFGDNLGKGRYGSVGQFSTLSSINESSNGTRDYNYRDNVQRYSQFAVYVQDNIFRKFGDNFLRLNAGVRYDLQQRASNLSPRLNASFSFRNKFIIRGGIGLSTKAPSLSMLYTGPRYLDFLLGDYRLPGIYSLAVVQTVVAPADNLSLKPSKSWRSEIGTDLKMPFATVAITAYNNRLYDGFTSYSKVTELDKAKVAITLNGNNPPTYQVVGSEKFRVLQTLQTNGYSSTDRGLEMLVNFKKIEKLHLGISLKANYTVTKSNQTVETIAKPTVEDLNVAYGIFSPYMQTSKLANAGVSLDYHVPNAGLIISVTSDHFLVDSKNSVADKYPTAYLDQNLVRQNLSDSDYNNPAIKSMVRSTVNSGYDMKGRTFHNFHLRVTKEFFSGIGISVYLNNMFNLKAYDNRGNEYTNFTPISFGGNLTYKF